MTHTHIQPARLAAPSSGMKAGRQKEARHRRTAAYVGLALLAVILIEAATGWLLWVAAHRRAALASAFLDALPTDWPGRPWLRWLFDVPSMTDTHVWFGYVLLGLTWVKLWAVWWLLRHWFPRRFSRRRLLVEKIAAWSLPLIYGVILLTGIMLDQRLGLVWGRDTVRDLHLWSSEAALPVTVWHLIRFLPTVWWIARRDAVRWHRPTNAA